jgi:hypothetical protein
MIILEASEEGYRCLKTGTRKELISNLDRLINVRLEEGFEVKRFSVSGRSILVDVRASGQVVHSLILCDGVAESIIFGE